MGLKMYLTLLVGCLFLSVAVSQGPTPTPLPPQCPITAEVGCDGVVPVECESDEQCQGLCCPTSCGGAECHTPPDCGPPCSAPSCLEGQYPERDAYGCPTCMCINPCENYECRPDEVCRPAEVQCVAPPCNPVAQCYRDPSKPVEGFCPETDIGSCAELCSDHFDCRSDELCCFNGCGHECLFAEPEPPVEGGAARLTSGWIFSMLAAGFMAKLLL